MWNRFLVSTAASAIHALCSGEYRRFQHSLEQPAISQQRLLTKLVADLARTDYGKHLSVEGEENYAAFVAKVPIVDYEGMQSWIDKQLSSDSPVMTPHAVVHVEPTSGSSGAFKRIPYTRPLLKSFSNMFRIWVCDLLRHGLKPETGRIFMSISPSLDELGFAGDDEYLPRPLRWLLRPFLVALPESLDCSVGSFVDSLGGTAQEALAVALLSEEKLEIISIWSPSYLLVLLKFIETNSNKLADKLSRERGMRELFRQRGRPARTFMEGSRLAALLSDPIDWKTIWPHLQLISCWDNALAEPMANQIRTMFPDVHVQGKGLLATEAPITIALVAADGCVPLVDEVFLEFEATEQMGSDPDASTVGGSIRRLHELQDGERYRIIVSQSGGLTRYCLGDLVEVRGFYRKTPKLVFVGRDSVCDLVGEKLHEHFVQSALTPLVPSGQFLLVPDVERRCYLLLVEDLVDSANQLAERSADTSMGPTADQLAVQLAERVDQALRRAHHYHQARCLRQLQKLQPLIVPNLLERLQAFHAREGMKLGNIKHAALMTDPAKARRFLNFLGILNLPQQREPSSAA